MEPEKFAAELISRLEAVLREREAEEKLEERLKRVQLVSELLKYREERGTWGVFVFCFFGCKPYF